MQKLKFIFEGLQIEMKEILGIHLKGHVLSFWKENKGRRIIEKVIKIK